MLLKHFQTKKDIEEAINKLVDLLEKHDVEATVVVFGAGLLIWQYRLQRATRDIDVSLRFKNKSRLRGLLNILSGLGFQVVSEDFLCLHPDFEDRLIFLDRKGNVVFLGLHPLDLAVSKIGACRGEEDLRDLVESGVLDEIDLEELKRLYFEAVSYWVGDEERFRTNWEVFRDYVERWEEKKKDAGARRACRKVSGPAPGV